MTFGTAAAALYCAGVLAVQAWVIASTSDYQEYYWPFLNYPMYSRSSRWEGRSGMPAWCCTLAIRTSRRSR
jgi:hypothetical protein